MFARLSFQKGLLTLFYKFNDNINFNASGIIIAQEKNYVNVTLTSCFEFVFSQNRSKILIVGHNGQQDPKNYAFSLFFRKTNQQSGAQTHNPALYVMLMGK